MPGWFCTGRGGAMTLFMVAGTVVPVSMTGRAFLT